MGGHSEGGGGGEDVCGQVGLLILRNWVTLSRTLIPGDTASSLPSGG